jgi:hypothetical protein
MQTLHNTRKFADEPDRASVEIVITYQAINSSSLNLFPSTGGTSQILPLYYSPFRTATGFSLYLNVRGLSSLVLVDP